MSPSKRTALHLDLDLKSEPIEGEVRADGGRTRPFVGWLGLTSALESAVGDGDPIEPEGEPHAP